MLAAQVRAGVAGDQFGGPRVHHDLLAVLDQGQVRQPGRIRRQPSRGLPDLGPGQGEGQVVQGHRGAADRDLPQHGRLLRRQQPDQALQQDVRAAQQHRLLDRGIHRTGRGQVRGLPPGQVPQFHLHMAEAGVAAAQQRVGELDQPRMPADRPDQHPPVLGLQRPQRRQPQEQPPQFGGRQGGDGDPGQEPVRPRQRIPARHQQRPGLGRLRQGGEDLLEGRIGEPVPAAGQVLLEVIEDQQQPLICQQPRDRGELGPVISRPGQHLHRGAQPARPSGDASLGDGLVHGADDSRDQGGGVPPALVHRDQPALIGQPRRDPAGQRGLADPADPGQHHPARHPEPVHCGPVAAHDSHRGAQLGAAADQRPHRQVPHQLAARRGRRDRQRRRRQRQVGQRAVPAAGQQRDHPELRHRHPALVPRPGTAARRPGTGPGPAPAPPAAPAGPPAPGTDTGPAWSRRGR